MFDEEINAGELKEALKWAIGIINKDDDNVSDEDWHLFHLVKAAKAYTRATKEETK